MKAAVYYENGPPSVLKYEDVADPVPGPRDVLIRVAAISIEGGDVLNRRLNPPVSAPFVLGYQAAGVIDRVGAEVTRIAVGQRVATFNWAGSHAALRAVPEHFVYPVPDNVDLQMASTIPVTFGTADDALFEFGRLTEGETVLILGGAGGVGLAAIQLAKAAGATVIATASSDVRLERLRAFGMDHGINYMSSNLAEQTLAMTGGKGVDVVVDMAGGTDVKPLIAALRYRGRVSLVGASSGQFPVFGFMDVVPKSLSVFGVLFGMEMHLPRVHEMVARHFAAAASGALSMPIDRVFPLSEAAAAHEHVQSGHPLGRVIIEPRP